MIESTLDRDKSLLSVTATDIHLSVIVPSWNEGWCIANTLTTLAQVLYSIPGVELIVVDDGSTDDTSEQVSRWIDTASGADAQVISFGTNRGKGRAVAEGFLRARGRYVAYIDADLDIPAEELRTLYDMAQALPGAVWVGSKQKDSHQRSGATVFRRLVSGTFAYLVVRLFRLPVRDTQTGLKVYPGPLARRIAMDMTVSGYLFDVELLILAQRFGAPMQEVPIRYAPQRAKNRIGWKHLLRSIRELVTLYHRYGHTTRKENHEIYYAHFDA